MNGQEVIRFDQVTRRFGDKTALANVRFACIPEPFSHCLAKTEPEKRRPSSPCWG